jgi:hypothetical protein
MRMVVGCLAGIFALCLGYPACLAIGFPGFPAALPASGLWNHIGRDRIVDSLDVRGGLPPLVSLSVAGLAFILLLVRAFFVFSICETPGSKDGMGWDGSQSNIPSG